MAGLLRTPAARALRASHRYFTVSVWRPLPEGSRPVARLGRRLSRLVYLVAHGFVDHNGLLRAAALSNQTLLALAPLLAILFSISKGVGLQGRIFEGLLARVAPGQQELLSPMVDYVKQTDLTALGTIGLGVLIYLAMSVLSEIERSFNAVWGERRSRTLHRKLTDYMSVLLIWPALVILSSGVTASIRGSTLLQRALESRLLSEVSGYALKALPLLTVWAAFAFLYIYMPNTEVPLKAALVGGVLAGTVWHLSQWAYIHFQVGVARYNAIYGTFSALPIFLVWLNLSWLIVMLGCELSYAYEHERTYQPETDSRSLSIAETEKLALHFLGAVWQRFKDGASPPNAGDLAAGVHVPRSRSLEVIDRLVQCGLLSRQAQPHSGLLPGCDLGRMPAGDLLRRVRVAGSGSDELAVGERIERFVGDADQRFSDDGAQPFEALTVDDRNG